MIINDRIIATIRTGVPALWGMFWAWLIAKIPAVADVLAWLSEWAGEDLYKLIELALTGLVIAAYYYVARWAGARWPWLERWLVGRSLVPIYETAGAYVIPAPSPDDAAKFAAGKTRKVSE